MTKHQTLSPGLWGLTALLLAALVMSLSACDFINPADESAPDEELHPVLIDGFWGFISSQGRIMITPNFETVGDFSNGMAAVQFGADWGYVN